MLICVCVLFDLQSLSLLTISFGNNDLIELHPQSIIVRLHVLYYPLFFSDRLYGILVGLLCVPEFLLHILIFRGYLLYLRVEQHILSNKQADVVSGVLK